MAKPIFQVWRHRIVLILALTAAAGCESREERCQQMVSLTSQFAEAGELSPIDVLDPYRGMVSAPVSMIETGIPYAASDDSDVRIRAVEYDNEASTEIADGLLRALRLDAELPATEWDVAVYSAQNWRGPGSVTCAHASKSELIDLVFYSVYGADIWTPAEKVLYLVLDTDKDYLVRIAQIDSPSAGRILYSAVLVRLVDKERIFRYQVVHETQEIPMYMLMATMELQGL